MRRIEVEALRGVPVYYRQPLEQAAAEAARAHQGFSRQRARSAGSALKVDGLQELIISIVQTDRKIGDKELQRRLKQHCRCPAIIEMSETDIVFVGQRGVRKRAPISGLKDRLSRAKKTLDSREPVSANP